MRASITSALLVSATLIAAGGCGEGFDPFNELNKLRVLAIRAEPPAILPGETAALDALVYEPSDEDVTYSWSWCPVTLGALSGYECAVDEEQVRQVMEENLPGSSSLLPSFDLGNEPTAAFALNIPAAALSALCEAEMDIDGIDVSDMFSCDEGLSITVRLDVSSGAERVSAVKELLVLTEDSEDRNRNPSLGAVFLDEGGSSVQIGDVGFALAPERRHDLRVSVPSSAAQTFTPSGTDDDPEPSPRGESLFMTWFVTGGETGAQRTTYIEDEIPMETLETNTWRTPAIDETGDGSARLFLVLQDERGGVAWTERRVTLEEE